MLISMAYAQEVAEDIITAAPEPPGNPFLWNAGFVLMLVFMFYFLLIRPQQKRFQELQKMLGDLKKGDKIITAGGLVGKIDKLDSKNKDEVLIDLGNNVKVTAKLSTLQIADEEAPKKDNKKEEKEKKDKK